MEGLDILGFEIGLSHGLGNAKCDLGLARGAWPHTGACGSLVDVGRLEHACRSRRRPICFWHFFDRLGNDSKLVYFFANLTMSLVCSASQRNLLAQSRDAIELVDLSARNHTLPPKVVME